MSKIDEKAKTLRKNLGLDEDTQALLGDIEMKVVTEGYTLADAIREGSSVTEQAVGAWGDGETACALTAAKVALKARGLL